MKVYRCAVIGQHPMEFPWGFDEEDAHCLRMKLALAQQIMELRQLGVTEFQVACNPGVGLYAGEIINLMKADDTALRLICVAPFEEQATKWTPQLRDRYFDMLANCTDLFYIAHQAKPGAQLLAYLRVINQADVVLAVSAQGISSDRSEERALRYALNPCKKPTLVLHPQTLTVQMFYPHIADGSH